MSLVTLTSSHGCAVVCSVQGALKHLRQIFTCIEIFLGQGTSQFALSLVITCDCLEAARRFVDGTEPKQSCRIRKELTRARILNDSRFATRQISNCAVAHP